MQAKANAKADCNQQKIVGQRKGPDHPVKGKTGIKHFEVKKRPKPATRKVGRSGFAIEDIAEQFDRQKGDHAADCRKQEAGRFLVGQNCGEGQDQRQHQPDFQAPHRGPAAYAAFKRLDPVDLFLLVKEEGEGDHHQKCATKGRN